jgi:hypothetical protein
LPDSGGNQLSAFGYQPKNALNSLDLAGHNSGPTAES